MWGGVKRKKDFGNVFREWSPSKGVDCLRSALFTEPRPWWIGWSLHTHRHWLDDRCSARLFRWCRAIFRLEHVPARKLEAYRNSQELFHVLQRGHRIGEDTFAEYLALCEAGGDLSSAFHWVKYFVQVNGSHDLPHYVWLLRVAKACPSDGDVEDTVSAVREVWDEVFAPQVENHPAPSHVTVLREELFRLCHELSPRIAEADLLQWIQDGFRSVCRPSNVALREGLDEQLCALLPALRLKPAGAFPVLELGCAGPTHTSRRVTLRTPMLIDSLLSAQFILRLEQDSFSHNVKGVVQCIQSYLAECTAMAAAPPNKPFYPVAPESGHRSALASPASISSPASSTLPPPPPAWNDYAQQATHNCLFRQQVVSERPGVTAELYHYLIVALSRASPRLALTTKEKMQQCGLRLLDLSRAVLVAACKDDEAVQVALVREQIREVAYRQKLDEDYECSAAVEAYWKYDYAQVLYFRNCLSLRRFYQLVVEELGVSDAQRVIAKSHDPPIEDHSLLVVHDHDARYAIRDALRAVSRGPILVHRTLDVITMHCPRLDLALMNDIPEFHDYCLPDSEDIATSMGDLRRRFANVSHVFVLDASFVEAHEDFVRVLLRANTAEPSGAPNGIPLDVLGGEVKIVVPYTALCQLADAVEPNGTVPDRVVCFDKNLHESRAQEGREARQRLRQIKALLDASPRPDNDVRSDHPQRVAMSATILHFSECLLSQAIPSELASVEVETNDDHQLLAIAALLRGALAEVDVKGNPTRGTPHPRVSLCTEDERLLREIRRKDGLAATALLAGINLVCTEVPTDAADVLANTDAHVCAAAATFVQEVASTESRPAIRIRSSPERRTTATADGNGLAPTTGSATTVAAESTWLAMLDDDEVAAEDHCKDSLGSASSSVDSQHYSVDATTDTENAPPRTADDERERHQRHGAAMFVEFDTKSPDERREEEMARQPPAELHESEARRWRPVSSALSKEARQNRGLSVTERRRVVRSMSRAVGGRVPFHLRYRVVEANVRDQRNRPIVEKYRQAVTSKLLRQASR